MMFKMLQRSSLFIDVAELQSSFPTSVVAVDDDVQDVAEKQSL